MKKCTKIILAIVFCILLIGILIWYFSYSPLYQRSIFNLVTLLGGYITLFGLPITIYQVFYLEDVTFRARDKWNLILLASEISKNIERVKLIKEWCSSGKHELAQLYISQVKDILIELTRSDITINKEEYSKIMKNINQDIHSIDRQRNNEADINITVFNKHMNALEEYLNNINHQLKIKNYGK